MSKRSFIRCIATSSHLSRKRQIGCNKTTPATLVISTERSCLAIHRHHVLDQVRAEVVNLESLGLALDGDNVVLSIRARNAVEAVEELSSLVSNQLAS